MKWKNRVGWRAVLLAGALLLFASSAQAHSCEITTIPVDFGNYSFLDPIPLDSTGEVSVTCRQGTDFDLILGPGMHPASQSPFRPRFMHRIQGVGILKYQLYTDFARTLVWGDGIHSNTDVCTESTCVATQTTTLIDNHQHTIRKFKVFGRVPLKQNVWVGDYMDTVTVTVQF